MVIGFDNVTPHPLKGKNFDESSAWGSKLSIDGSNKHLLISDSGKGKTTFLSFVYGSRTDFDGVITIDDKPWSEFSLERRAEFRRRKISFLPQDIRLFPKLSAIDNLKIKNGLTAHRTIDELKDLLALFGLKEQINQSAQTLSYGQQQRVGIIRALIQPFELLLLDEPFSHLDEKNISIGVDLINQFCALNNAGYIISSLGPEYGLSPDEKIVL